MKSNFKAFTLIELLVVLFIISLFFTFTLPRFSGIFLKFKKRQFIQRFVNTISMVASEALTFKHPSYFFINGEKRTYGFSQNVYSIPEDVEIYAKGLEETSPGYYRLYFYPDGTCSQAEMEVTYDRKKYAIFIQPLTSTIRWYEIE